MDLNAIDDWNEYDAEVNSLSDHLKSISTEENVENEQQSNNNNDQHQEEIKIEDITMNDAAIPEIVDIG